MENIFLLIYLFSFKKNGWMDFKLMIQYIDYFNNKKNNRFEMLKLIIYDFFKGYLEKSVKEKFKENDYNLAIIPNGLISIY